MDRIRLGYRFGDVTVDPHAHRVMRAGQPVALEPKAFALLQVLLDHPGELLSRDELLDSVWKHRHVAPATLNRIVALLRRALGDDADTPHFIETVHGLGYRFVGAVQLEGRDAPLDPEPAEVRAPTVSARSTAPPYRTPLLLVLALLAVAGLAAALNAMRQAPPVAEKSIAVLPFQNLAADKNNEWFIEGLRDEVLTRLAGIRDLKVISRSSADRYASRPEDVRGVARQLGVGAILEGSVQRTGDSVHINLQLIDAASDTHLWADSYDRTLDDVFSMERDVAETVAAALKVQLLPEERLAVAHEPTQSPQAHEHYLRALAYFTPPGPAGCCEHRELFDSAIAEYDRALALDRDFALARAMLAQTQMYKYWYSEQRSSELLAAAKTNAEEALAQQPGLGEARVALALYHYYGFRNYALSLGEIERARATMPNSAKVETIACTVERRQGQWDRALASARRAVELDPRSGATHGMLTTMYYFTKDYGNFAREASVLYRLEGGKGDDPVASALARMHGRGDMSGWPAALAGFAPGSDAYVANLYLFYLHAWLTRDFAAAAHYAEISREPTWTLGTNIALPRDIWLAWAYSALHEDAKARPLYEAARASLLRGDPIRGGEDEANRHLAIAFAAAGLGKNDEARREALEAAEAMPLSRDALDAPDYLYGLALVYLSTGERDKALDQLQQIAGLPALPYVSPGFLKFNAQWDPVRDDPRFQRVLLAVDAAIKSRPAEN
jgi:serine/threonine-protein kinase